MHFQLISAVTFAILATACSPGGGAAKAPDSIDRMSKAEVHAIVKEMFLTEPEFLEEVVAKLEENKAVAQAKTAEAAWATMSKVGDDPSIGPANAPITIVEFTDYNCGYCKAAVSWVMNQVDDRRGDVRLVVKESAVRGTNSELAAAAALSAQKQGKWREMHIALMRVPANAYTPEIVDTIAKSVGLDMNRFQKDLASKETKQRMERSIQEYQDVGLEGTPTFFINGAYVGGFGEDHLNDLVKQEREKLKKS
jgi:protein-disulfide isomerase